MKSIPNIEKLLIANRGEIALRVMRTCHTMGIATVAVYSEPDAGAPFVAAADEAIALGGASARESYLVIEKILAAAHATGAQAIHPGYGFLSENPRFAEACEAAGLVFIGPSADTIRRLGAKREAKQLAAAAGVPVVPGYGGEDQSIAAFAANAESLGYPLLLKASAGGGGRGMHVLRGDEGKEGFALAVERAKREALAAFGDDTLLLERYIERPRHVEVQILGDLHGHLIHLHERECSIQRRHQKILEEAPSPTLSEETRLKMGEAAVVLGKTVHYVSAGTVEFIVDPKGAFYFLEVNTRLQVEHPVTELICGIDLVAEQLRIAQGQRLRWKTPPPHHGHAIEVRLCAEDPQRDYLPSTGTLALLALPVEEGVRCDLGVVAGSEIGIHYDSMLGKLIAHAPTRGEAAAKLRRVLQRGLVAGLPTNADLLARLLGHPAFLAAELDTHFLEHHADSLRGGPGEGAAALEEAALAATLAGLSERRTSRPISAVTLGWHNVPVGGTLVRYRSGERTSDAVIEVRYQLRGDGAEVTVAGKRFAVRSYWLAEAPGGGVVVEAVLELDVPAAAASIGEAAAAAAADAAAANAANAANQAASPAVALAGHRRRWRIARQGERTWVAAAGHTLLLVEEPRFPERVAAAAAGSLLAPMPGKVVKVLVAEGDRVTAGAPILMLEAMKMEHTIRAAVDGAVTTLRVAVGDQVAADEVLAVVS